MDASTGVIYPFNTGKAGQFVTSSKIESFQQVLTTSTGYILKEVAETYLLPLLHSLDEAVVFEVGQSILLLASKMDSQYPNWILCVIQVTLSLLILC